MSRRDPQEIRRAGTRAARTAGTSVKTAGTNEHSPDEDKNIVRCAVDVVCGSDDDGNGTTYRDHDFNRVALAEMPRMFTLVCSNDEERHAVKITYRHRFRLELQAVIQERRNPRLLSPHSSGIVAGGDGEIEYGRDGCGALDIHEQSEMPTEQTSPPEHFCSVPAEVRQVSMPLPVPVVANSFVSGGDSLLNGAKGKKKTSSSKARCPGSNRESAWRINSVSAQEFEEALMRCPGMVEAFGNNLAARLRYRHRPPWMAPILRGGGGREL